MSWSRRSRFLRAWAVALGHDMCLEGQWPFARMVCSTLCEDGCWGRFQLARNTNAFYISILDTSTHVCNWPQSFPKTSSLILRGALMFSSPAFLAVRSLNCLSPARGEVRAGLQSQCMKRCLTSLALGEMQTQTTKRYHFTPTRSTMIEVLVTMWRTGWECDMEQLLERT